MLIPIYQVQQNITGANVSLHGSHGGIKGISKTMEAPR